MYFACIISRGVGRRRRAGLPDMQDGIRWGRCASSSDSATMNVTNLLLQSWEAASRADSGDSGWDSVAPLGAQQGSWEWLGPRGSMTSSMGSGSLPSNLRPVDDAVIAEVRLNVIPAQHVSSTIEHTSWPLAIGSLPSYLRLMDDAVIAEVRSNS